MIYITGDIHGSLSARRLGTKGSLPKGLTRDDYVIVLGDFGLVWFPEEDRRHKEDKWWLDWLEEKPFTTLFIDGNHENHDLLSKYAVSEWKGARVHCIRENVIHLMRGQVFDLDGKSIFTMGGAYSHDIEYRTEGLSWWRGEVPSQAEREEALATLEARGWSVDYVLTHCAPSGVLPLITGGNHLESDEYTNWLQCEIADRLRFKEWFFGHYHVNQAVLGGYRALYGCFYDLNQKVLFG